MIAIAPDEVAHVALAPDVEELSVTESRLVLLPLVEDFVHDHEAHAVGEVEQGGRRRIVARPDRIDAQRFHDLQLPFDAAIERRRAERAEVVVKTDALHRHVDAVQHQALGRDELDGADAERRAGFIDVAWRPRRVPASRRTRVTTL